MPRTPIWRTRCESRLTPCRRAAPTVAMSPVWGCRRWRSPSSTPAGPGVRSGESPVVRWRPCCPSATAPVPPNQRRTRRRNRFPSVLIGLLLALGTTVCYGAATVLQAAATRSVDPGSGDSGVDAALLLRALRQWRYLVGIGLDGLGFVLQVAALRWVPISAVAAAFAASLAVTAIVAAWVLHTRLSRLEWAAVAVVCASLAMLGLAAGPEGSGHGPPQLGWALLVIVAVVFIAGAAAGRLSDRTRALVLGLGAGFGVVEIAVRLIDSIDLTKAAFYTNPAVYAVITGGLAGFLLLTSALSRGSVTTAVAGMVVGETVGPALVGVAWLGDQTRPGLSWMVVTGFVIAVAATLALSRFGEAPQPAKA